MNSNIKWNNSVRIVISDVDDTIAPVFQPASAQMIAAIESLLHKGCLFLFVSGQGLSNILQRVVMHISPSLRKQTIIAPCNGAEAYCFDPSGGLVARPLYSVKADHGARIDTGAVMPHLHQVLANFDMASFSVCDVGLFRLMSGNDPMAVMVDVRNVQISLDFVNWMFEPPRADIRSALIRRLNQEFIRNRSAFRARSVGAAAIDILPMGVSKGLPIRRLISWGESFRNDLPRRLVVQLPEEIEVWGDQFSETHNGPDLAMSRALPRETRTISFREIPGRHLPMDRDVTVWPGDSTLDAGVLEYIYGPLARRRGTYDD
jgi:hydroxymethylpyrimidine pyrophosphatase-like HAD family hydrolase